MQGVISFIPKRKPVMGRQRGAKEISEERRKTIFGMHDIGVRQCDIVLYYKMPQSTVSNIICRRRIPKRTQNNGPKMKQTSRATRTLLKIISENKFQPSSVIASIYNKFAPVHVSARTVRRTLNAMEYKTMLLHLTHFYRVKI